MAYLDLHCLFQRVLVKEFLVMLLVLGKENWTLAYILNCEVNISLKSVTNLPNAVIQPWLSKFPCYGNRPLLDEILVKFNTEVIYVVVPFRQSVDVIHESAK